MISPCPIHATTRIEYLVIDSDKAKEIAKAALNMNSNKEVEKLLEKNFSY